MTTTATTTATITSVTLAAPPPAPCCPQCGFISDDGDPQQRIQDLEAQVKYLNDKASATASKLANYEDEIRSLRSQVSLFDNSNNHSADLTTLPPTPSISPEAERKPVSPPPSSQQLQSTSPPSQTRLATLTSFFPYGRRPSHQQLAPTSPTHCHPSVPDNNNLQDALSRETALRKDAESRLTQANSELEDLTAQLFSQANEMVAQERRARAKLEERVEVLEKRDGEKRRRLERLEAAIERVERIRGLVGR